MLYVQDILNRRFRTFTIYFNLSPSPGAYIYPPPPHLGRLGVAGSPLGPYGPRGLHPHPINPVFYGSPPRPGGEFPAEPSGRLFSGRASRLDAFSGYPLRRGCPALPARTTGTLEAAAPRSSRTEGTFPSGGQHPRQVETDLSHDGLNPSHVPL